MAKTYEKSDLEAAMKASGISDAAAQRMRKALNERDEAVLPPPDQDRQFRYSFTRQTALPALGILVLLIGLSLTSSAFLFEFGGIPVIAVSAWISLYYRDRRDGLAQLVLFLAFAIHVAMSSLHIALNLGPHQPDLSSLAPAQGLLVAGTCAIACFGYWHIFRFPLSFAFGAASRLTLGDHLLGTTFTDANDFATIGWPFIFAIMLLVLAAWFDMSDVYRETVRSDVAFWLHAIGGLVLVTSCAKMLFATELEGFSSFDASPDLSGTTRLASGLVFGTCIAVSAAALLFDRITLAIFSGTLLATSAHAMLGMAYLPFTLLLTGGGFSLVAVFWRRLRRQALSALPLAISAQLPREHSRIDGRRPIL